MEGAALNPLPPRERQGYIERLEAILDPEACGSYVFLTDMDEQDIFLQELEHYRKEKDRIRRILGKIGGVSNLRLDKTVNTLFLILVVLMFAFDVVRELLHLQLGGFPHFLSTQLALFIVSLKIVWMIHRQSRVDHFQFWILSSIEYQVNLLSKKLERLEGGDAAEPPKPPSG